MARIKLEKPAIFRSFPYLWAWHRLTGSMDYYIIDLCERAKRDGAGTDAIYFDGRKWRYASELAEGHDMMSRMRELITNTFGEGAL